MAKVAEEMVQQTTERAIEATHFGVNWIREMAEQNIGQTKDAMESLMTLTRRTVGGLNYQGSVIYQHALLLAEQTLSNSLDFGNNVVRAREPQELIRLQTEFMAKQAELFAGHAKKLERSIVQTTDEMISGQKEVQRRLGAK